MVGVQRLENQLCQKPESFYEMPVEILYFNVYIRLVWLFTSHSLIEVILI